MYLRQILTEDSVKDLDKILKPYLKNNHTSRDWAVIIMLTARPTLWQLQDLFDQYSSAIRGLSPDEIYRMIDHYIDTYPAARALIVKAGIRASHFPYKERVLNTFFQQAVVFPSVIKLEKEHQLNKENDLWDPVKLREISPRRGSLSKPKPQTTHTPTHTPTPTDAEPSTPTDAEPSTPDTDRDTDDYSSYRSPWDPPNAQPGTEQALLSELWNHAINVDGWGGSGWRYRDSDAVQQIVSLIIAASPQAGLAAMQQLVSSNESYYPHELDESYGKKNINYRAILEILKKYKNVEKTNPVLKAWEDLPSDLKNVAWQKYRMHVKYGISLKDTGSHPGWGGEPPEVDPDDIPKLPSPTMSRDKAEESLDRQMQKYDNTYIDDTEEILGKKYFGYTRKLSPEEISAFFRNVSVVTANYDVFEWNMQLLIRNNFVDPINNLSDPILQLGIMGDPRNIESALKATEDLKVKYPERKVIARWPGMGIWGAAYGGPYTEDTILAGEDQLMSYHPARAARTDAHEIRHRAFNIISLLPALRDRIPADLRPGGI